MEKVMGLKVLMGNEVSIICALHNWCPKFTQKKPEKHLPFRETLSLVFLKLKEVIAWEDWWHC